jgi:hypothetical protein
MKLSPDPQFTPEQEVLLWAIRVDHTKDLQIAGILRSGVDWRCIRETAAQHGIIPLLYKRLKGELADAVPPRELAALRTFFMENTIRNLRMTQNLLTILNILADSDIRAMPFKGPALAVQAYGDLSMRSFCDLDILIDDGNIYRVSQILLDRGYVLNDPLQTNIEKRVNPIYQKDLHFTFRNDSLEIHWKIIERLYAVHLDMDQIWDGSVPVLINGQEINTLSPEDMVLVLCFHGLKHGFNPKWLADLIHMVSNNPDLRWQDLFNKAEKTGLKRIVLIGLFLARQQGGIRMSPDAERLLVSDPKVPLLAGEFHLNIFRFNTPELAFTNPFFYIRLRENFTDQMTFLVNFYREYIPVQVGKLLGINKPR